jgi:hypothetical protein
MGERGIWTTEATIGMFGEYKLIPYSNINSF